MAKALTILGNQVNFLSLIGDDFYNQIIRAEVATIGIQDQFLLSALRQTAQSVIIYENSGQRQIHTDLKDIQDQNYPLDQFSKAVEDCDLCILCNINFNHHLLDVSRSKKKTIATDVHAIHDPDDPYNRDFMAAADILFLSHENLTVAPQNFIQSLWDRYENQIIVIGMGEQGAMLGVRAEHLIFQIPSIQTRQIQNTIGAGDALFSSFLNEFLLSKNPLEFLQKAVLFASYKIGCVGAAEGFINRRELSTLYNQFRPQISPINITI